MFNEIKNKWILAVFGVFFIYLIFIFSIDWNKRDRDCQSVVEINSISSENKPFEVKSGVCYWIHPGGSHEMYYKYLSHGGKGVYLDIDNFPKGAAFILNSYDRDSTFQNLVAFSRWGQFAVFSSVEEKFEYFDNKVRAGDYYFFSIEISADPNNTYGYDLYFEELDEIPE